MLERIVEFLREAAGSLKFGIIVEDWEQGVVLRWGRYHRTILPGFHWHWPLGIETVITDTVVTSVDRTEAQSVTTADGVGIVLSASITWHVEDVRTLLLSVSHKEHVLLDAVPGIIAQAALRNPWAVVTTEEFGKELTKKVRARARRYGIVVDELQLRDIVQCSTLRLVQALPVPGLAG